jgi:cellulose biosynthesis protein BcsQ
MSQIPGTIITFYSFKGGTGRSMALANVASLIAIRNGGKTVLAVDWDLEAPGLHRYFHPYLTVSDPDERDSEIEAHTGLIELLTVARDRALAMPPGTDRNEILAVAFSALDLNLYTMRADLPGLSLMKAGCFDKTYSSRINTFEWEPLFKHQPAFFGAFADYLSSQFDYVLIDSRTGHTDISGICTCLMPDALVAVFTPNRQSLEGALGAVRQAVEYRLSSDDLRPLNVFPLASRIELSEKKLNDAWRLGDENEEIEGYQPRFESEFRDIYGLDSCDLTAYFDAAQIQYVPFYSFGEKIAVRLGESANFSLTRSYETLTDIVVKQAVAWERLGDLSQSETSYPELPPIPRDDQWFREQRVLYAQFPGPLMSVEISLETVKGSTSRAKLFNSVRQSAPVVPFAIPRLFRGFPSPSPDGVFSREHAPLTFWALRADGNYILVRHLPEPEDQVLVEFRVWQIAEALVFCSRLYKSLGISARAKLRLVFEHSGLFGKTLATRARFISLDISGMSKYRPASVDRVVSTLDLTLGRIENDLVGLVRTVAEPIFEVFDFASFDAEVYRDLVAEFLELNEK